MMSVLFVEQNSNLCAATTALSQQKKQHHQQQQSQQQHQHQQHQQQQLSPSSHNAAANGANIEDQRALQLAFELSMLGLSDSLSTCNTNGNGGVGSNGNDMIVNMGMNDTNGVCHQHSSPSSLSPSSIGVNGNHISANGLPGVVANNMGLSAFTTMLPNLDDRSKKSQNMTECVPVPSSEHVAEIVGRQGECLFSSFSNWMRKIVVETQICTIGDHFRQNSRAVNTRMILFRSAVVNVPNINPSAKRNKETPCTKNTRILYVYHFDAHTSSQNVKIARTKKKKKMISERTTTKSKTCANRHSMSEVRAAHVPYTRVSCACPCSCKSVWKWDEQQHTTIATTLKLRNYRSSRV